MIDRFTATLSSLVEHEAALQPKGAPIVLRVLLPAYLAERLASSVGEVVSLHTLLYLESHGQGTSFVPRLVGFGSSTERSFFELFTTVKGIGSRKALRAMAVEPAQIARAIAGRDTRALVELPEIGKRLAETIVAELDGKVARFLNLDEGPVVTPGRAARPGQGLPPFAGEALAALQTLGESAADAERMVRTALAMEPKPSSADELIQAAYRVGR
jgi:Holliday junction DNA helicase RuvA